MKKLLAIAALVVVGFNLGGCASLPTINLQGQVNLNTLEGVVAGYGVAVNQENLVKLQPLCKTGTTPSITNLCVKRSIIVRLQNADKITNTTINRAALFVKNNPTIDPSQYIKAASDALTAFLDIVNDAKSGS